MDKSKQIELLKAISEYKGPITKLRPGEVSGARDLKIWSINRASGGSGVPDEDAWAERWRRARKFIRKHQKRIERQSNKIKRWARKRTKQPMFEDGDTSGPPPWE